MTDNLDLPLDLIRRRRHLGNSSAGWFSAYYYWGLNRKLIALV